VVSVVPFLSVADPIPPLGGHALLLLLLQLGLLGSTAVLVGRLAARLSMPAVVGELLAGVLLGPSLLGYAWPALSGRLFPHDPAQLHLLDAVGQFGVVLLVGLTGLQLDTGLVRGRGRTALRVSLPGFVLPLGLGIAGGYLIPARLLPDGAERGTVALFLGVALSVSALPVIARILMDMRLTHRNVGQLILIVGTVDDLLGWVGLSVVTAIATVGLHSADLARPLLGLAGFLLLAFVAGRPLVRAIMRVADRGEEPGPSVAATVGTIVLCATVTQALGLEAVFGALVGGMLVGTAGPAVLRRLAGLRTVVTAVLAPLFFATVGLRTDFTTLAHPATALTALVLLVIAVVSKFGGALIGARLSGLNRWEALALGAGINVRGVVQVVVAMVGIRIGLLDTALYTVVVLIAVVTSLASPPVLRAAMRRLETTAEERLRQDRYMIGGPSQESAPVADTGLRPGRPAPE